MSIATVMLFGALSASQAAPASQAMLEVRVFEATGEGEAASELFSGYAEELDTFRLDTALMALERGGEGALPGMPGLGRLTGAAVLTAPRIIAQAGEEASVESGVLLPRTAVGEEEIDVRFEKSALSIDSLYDWADPGSLARVELEAQVAGQKLAGTFRLRPGETAYLAQREGSDLLVLTLTFRPLN